jgi:hypothetical protein
MSANRTAAQGPATAPRFSMDECRRIAADYDGTPQSIDALMARWGAHKPGLKRRHITRAAVRGGYQPATRRRPWSAEDNAWLLQHWSKLSDEAMAEQLRRPLGAIQQQYRRLRSAAGDSAEPMFSLGALRRLTGVDPRDWRSFIDRGWLEAQQRQQGRTARHRTSVSAAAVRVLLQAHPEVLAYQQACDEAHQALGLAQLPAPPRLKRVTCRSKVCRQHGGTAFWVPVYAAPHCPRCGRLTSRLSTLAQYRDDGDDAPACGGADRVTVKP